MNDVSLNVIWLLVEQKARKHAVRYEREMTYNGGRRHVIQKKEYRMLTPTKAAALRQIVWTRSNCCFSTDVPRMPNFRSTRDFI